MKIKIAIYKFQNNEKIELELIALLSNFNSPISKAIKKLKFLILSRHKVQSHTINTMTLSRGFLRPIIKNMT